MADGGGTATSGCPTPRCSRAADTWCPRSPARWSSPKNPAVSLIVSFFLPGVGSMINGDTNRGILILALYLVSALAIIVLIGIPFAIGIWIWGMVDAYQGAQAWNRAHGILS